MKPLCGVLRGCFDFGGVEQEGGNQGAFFGGFEEGVELVTAGPVVVLDFAEETVEEAAGDLVGIDPFVGECLAEGFA